MPDPTAPEPRPVPVSVESEGNDGFRYERPTAPAGDLRERLTECVKDIPTGDDAYECRIPNRQHRELIADAVLAVLRKDTGTDMAERFAAKLTSLLGHTWCDRCYPADWAGRAGAAMTGVRDEELWRLQAREEFAEGEMASLRDHGTRWETEKARADKAEYDLEIRTHTARSNARAQRIAYLESEKQRERAEAAEAQVAALQRELAEAVAHNDETCNAFRDLQACDERRREASNERDNLRARLTGVAIHANRFKTWLADEKTSITVAGSILADLFAALEAPAQATTEETNDG